MTIDELLDLPAAQREALRALQVRAVIEWPEFLTLRTAPGGAAQPYVAVWPLWGDVCGHRARRLYTPMTAAPKLCQNLPRNPLVLAKFGPAPDGGTRWEMALAGDGGRQILHWKADALAN
jgi:hypothetical protein